MARCYAKGEEIVPGFKLLDCLGRGGFGEVWKVSAPGGTEAAIKIINLTGSLGRKEFRSLQLVKRLRHPNLLPIYAMWIKDESANLHDAATVDPQQAENWARRAGSTDRAPGTFRPTELIIAMGLGEKNLFDRLQECIEQGKRGIPASELLSYVKDVARAIDFLNSPRHDLGLGPVAIQHCDIKPQNMLIVGGAAQVCDFGLARTVGEVRMSDIPVSFAYGAPEYIEKRPSATTDQYSLAISYFELRTGSLPFADESFRDVITAHLEGKLDSSQLSPREREVFQRATARDPAKRYPSAVAMVRCLRLALAKRSSRSAMTQAPASAESTNLLEPNQTVPDGTLPPTVADPPGQDAASALSTKTFPIPEVHAYAVLEPIDDAGISGHHTLRQDRPVLIGRGHECNIRLDIPKVSRRHCLLEFANGRWHIQDLLSANGTFVNGHLVQNADLGENDVVAIGKLRFRFRLLHDQSETRESTAGTAAQVSGLTSAKTEKLSIEVTQLSDAPARCFANRFELQNVIHRGSTGSFYKALDLEKDCVVCVELLSPTMSRDEPELKRFVRSLRKATRLRHDNIVRLLRAGRYKSQWWLAMEYVDGPSLREVIEQNAKGIAPARVVEIALDVTTALEKAHRRQLVHRAITPGKVLLTKAGAAKLSGFAFVDNAVLANLQRQSALTKLVHDLTYMAPECVEHASRADCRADIYSLAACLYTLLTGCPPFTGELAEQLIEIRKEMPIPIRRLNPVVPRQLEDIIMRCLAKDPVERFQNPLQLREELNRIGKATD